MARYATRPIEVEAVRFDGTRECAEAIVRAHAYVTRIADGTGPPTIVVQAATGDYEATEGDWVVTLGPNPIVLADAEFNAIFGPVSQGGNRV